MMTEPVSTSKTPVNFYDTMWHNIHILDSMVLCDWSAAHYRFYNYNSHQKLYVRVRVCVCELSQ
jgi:hypothetical protein